MANFKLTEALEVLGGITGSVPITGDMSLTGGNPFVAVGTTPAQQGAFRLTNTQSIFWRNAAGIGDIQVLTVNAADDTRLNVADGNILHFTINDVSRMNLQGANGDLTLAPGSLTLGSTASTTGDLRTQNSFLWTARNVADDGDLTLMDIVGDILSVGPTAASVRVVPPFEVQNTLTLSNALGDIVFQNAEQQILWNGCSTYFISNMDTPDELLFGGNTVSLTNAIFSIEGTTVFKFRNGANDEQYMSVRQATTTVSTPSGATATAIGLIPAGSFLVGVTARVTTAVTGPAGFDIGDGVTVDRWGNSIAVGLNTTTTMADYVGATGHGSFPAANDVVLTSDGVDFTGGVVRLTVHYMQLSPAAS